MTDSRGQTRGRPAPDDASTGVLAERDQVGDRPLLVKVCTAAVTAADAQLHGAHGPGQIASQRSEQRLDQHAVAVATNHVGRTRSPVAIAGTTPRNLDALHGCAALVARRRGNGNEFLSIHASPCLPWAPLSGVS